MGKKRTELVPDDDTEAQTVKDAFFSMDSEAVQTMYNSHGAVMYIVDLESFRIVDANKSALKFYGHDINTMRTKRIPNMNITPEEKIRIEIYANPIFIKDKEYSFSIIHDITARRIAEMKLKQKEID